MTHNGKKVPWSSIINYTGAVLAILVVIIGGVTYIVGIDSKAQAAVDSVDNIEKQRAEEKREWTEALRGVTATASAAQADASATRKYTEFIVNRLGGNTEKILATSSTPTNSNQ